MNKQTFLSIYVFLRNYFAKQKLSRIKITANRKNQQMKLIKNM
jgi:hypothetical protein